MIPDISGTHVLDLYAGSGALGFEALSRGAASVTFVDRGADAIRLLRQNARQFGKCPIDIIRADSIRFLNRKRKRFDIIFADPPYGLGNLALIKRQSWENLKKGGYLVIESAVRDGFRDEEALIKRYGDTQVSIFNKR